MTSTRLVLIPISVVATIGIVWTVWATCQTSREQVLNQVESLMMHGKSGDALKLLRSLTRPPSVDQDTCFRAGEMFARMKQFDEAVESYLRVPQGTEIRAEACFRAGDLLLLKLFQLSRAEGCLRETLHLNSQHQAARGHLAGLYGFCGLTNLTADLRLKRVRDGQFTEIDLLILALGDTAAEEALPLREIVRASPEDPLVLLAQGHQTWQRHDPSAARRFYEQSLSKRPDLDDAQARLGRILAELNDEAAFQSWFSGLSPSARCLPETWAVAGDWSLNHDCPRGAVRCFWEAVRKDSTHRRAIHGLGQALASLGDSELAAPFQHRNERLQEYLLAAKQFTTDPSGASLQRIVTAATACQLDWEAWGWARIFRNRDPSHAESASEVPRPDTISRRVGDSTNPGTIIDLSQYPLPEWMQRSDKSVTPTESHVRHAAGLIHFVDEADRTGMRFRYVNGDSLPGPGMRIFQFTGGGVGVLDYDRDGWPDLYFTQGGRWPVPESNPPSDVLFRNRSGAMFDDVSVRAGIRELDYSQGLAVGDVDADGWDDIFVANVAGNRLFHNNGDGTFCDVTELSGVSDSAWSTSAVCADFNGDGLPDLYVVNYLTGPNLLDRICRRSDGRPRSCTPHEFAGAEDQLLLNLGNGQFRDVSLESGVTTAPGKGLGVVAADFTGNGQLSLFVSNDTSGNFFLQNETAVAESIPRFHESAVVTGLAFDGAGRTQACMGIAAGDAEGDESLDLFVTNYYLESNTLYRREAGLLFADATSPSGLREPSLKQLGFGTQFLDVDLDGWNDLVVTNGHVDDETDEGIPLHMPTQVFLNTGRGRFTEIDSRELGPWFEQKYLGRSLVRLDWNRDGMEDFVVSNLDSPAALMTNTSEQTGRYLAVQLVGTDSARQPIGASVRVRASNGRAITKQLTAGDGYQASNERQLVFGVGSDRVVELAIQWPSGTRQVFPEVETNQTLLIIEGRGVYPQSR